MRICLFRGSLTLVLLGAFFILSFGQDCKDSEDYDGQNYKIRHVRVSTPLGWLLSSVDDNIRVLINNPEMPVKEQDVFSSNHAAQGYVWLRRNFPELKVSPDSRFAIRLGGNSIANCDEQTKSLDVVYKLFVFSPSYYYSRAYEIGGEPALKRATVDTDATQKLANYKVQPYFGYNNTRKVFAGTKFTATLPNSFINKFEIDAAGSSQSSEVKFAAVGTDNYQKGLFRYSEWRLGYRFSSVPSDRAKLRQGEGSGQVYLASRGFTEKDLILRFGGALESGNRQSDDLRAIVPPSNLRNSGVTNVKGFVGATMKVGLHSLKASYGLQLGNATNGLKLDFVKQVFDSAANLKFPHLRDFTVEGEFTAGTINRRGNLPIVEKFYGGNTEKSFIEGGAWQIRANPFIRSFPENKLSQVDGSGILGLDSFASVNLTLSVQVWRRPLVPRDVWEDPKRPGQLEPRLEKGIEKSFVAGESQITSSYMSQSSEYKAVVKPVTDMGPVVAGLNCLLRGTAAAGAQCSAPGIPNSNPGIQAQLKLLFVPPVCDDCAPSGTFDVVATSVSAIIEDDAKEVSDPDTIRALVVDLPPDVDDPSDETWRSQINALGKSLMVLEGLLPAPTAGDVRTLRTRLESQATEAREKLEILDRSSRAIEAKQMAKRDLIYPRHVLDYLIREANLFSLSPILIFDAARVRQVGVPNAGSRYGVGGGLKFTFIGLDVRGGYVWSPNPGLGEQKGAFLFRFDVADIFK